MGILDGLRRLFPGDKPDAATPTAPESPAKTQVGNNFKGEPLFAEDIVTDIKKKLEKRRADRRVFELQWLLNSNFLANRQYCDINTYSGEIEDIDPPYDYSERGVYNRITPLMETRMSNMKTVHYEMTVNPRTNEVDDWEKADISTKLLRYTQSNTNFNDCISDLVIPWAETTGTSFVMSWWDTGKGEEVSRSQTITLENGVEKAVEEVIREGDLSYGVLSSYEVFPESLYRQNVEDQHDIIVEQVMNVEDIYDKYNVRAEGKRCDSYVLTPIPGANSYGQENTVYGVSTQSVEDCEKVILYFEKRSRAFPDGKIAIIIGNELIYYGGMPYETIPIVSIKSKIVVGQFFGKSVIQDLIPLQRAFNATCNKILEYIQTIAANPIFVPKGSIEDIDEFIENGIPPNAIIEYDANVTNGKPEFGTQRDLPQTVVNQYQSLKNDMEYSAGVSQLMVYGQAPNGANSGVAIENLRQIDSTRLSLTTENVRSAIKKIAIQWLKIYKDRLPGYRVCLISGSNDVGGAVVWCSDDINSYDIEFDTENELVLSEDKQRQNFLQAWQLGLFTDENGQVPREIRQKFIELMKLGRYSDMMGESDLQRQAARREYTFFMNGVIPQRGEFDDDDIHLGEHTKQVLQMRFITYSKKNPEYSAQFYAHMKEHQAAIAQKAMSEMQTQLQGGNGAAVVAPVK